MKLPVITCPHHYKGFCIKASNILGIEIFTFPTLCKISCPKWGGPCEGRPVPEEALGPWAKKMLECSYSGLVEKVAQRYKKPIDIWIPDLAGEVREKFKHITDLPWVKSIGLTGSILSKNISHRDIDVVLSVTDMRTFIDAEDTLNVPKHIRGLKVDLFVSEQSSAFFMTLDLDKLVLYKSGLYNISSIDPRIKEVVETNNELYTTFRDEPKDELPKEVETEFEEIQWWQPGYAYYYEATWNCPAHAWTVAALDSACGPVDILKTWTEISSDEKEKKYGIWINTDEPCENDKMYTSAPYVEEPDFTPECNCPKNTPKSMGRQYGFKKGI